MLVDLMLPENNMYTKPLELLVDATWLRQALTRYFQ